MTLGNKELQKVIMVVDDDQLIRLLLGEALEAAGFRVEKAEDGAGALALLDICTPDLIMLDVIMPGMDGFETCARIRDIPEIADIPIVLVTGSNDLDSIKRAYELGVTDFITKPISWGVIGYRANFILRATKAFHDLKTSERRLVHAQHIAKVGNWDWMLETDRIWLSEEAQHILQLDLENEETSYQVFIDSVHPVDRVKVERAMTDAIEQTGYYSIDHQLLKSDGAGRFVHSEAEVIKNWKNMPIRLEGTIQDISDRKSAEEKIRNLVYVDSLTGLPNRLLFMEHINRIHQRAQIDQGKYAVLFLDIDGFKIINDTFGHAMGDSLLQKLAQRLRNCVRTSDLFISGMVARLGGDEFVLVIDSIVDVENIAVIAKRIIEQTRLPVQLETVEVVVTVSIGISIYPDDGDDAGTLIKNADIAMYSAKDQGKCTFQFFTKSIHELVIMQLRVENNLKMAIKNNEFSLCFQPQIDLVRRKIVGFEALIRWHNRELGEVLPEFFIPLAEKSNLIWEVDCWVLGEACRQLRKWHDAGLPDLRVAVNLSGRSLKQENLVAIIGEEIKRNGINPQSLQLELTEGVLMVNAAKSMALLAELKKMGVSLAIDDFGTGYSSLAYLQNLPIDTLKIDQSFVAGISENDDSAPVISAIIALAQSLNLSVIAEGIERETQQNFLRTRGCHLGQGFFYGRPVNAVEVPPLVRGLGLRKESKTD